MRAKPLLLLSCLLILFSCAEDEREFIIDDNLNILATKSSEEIHIVGSFEDALEPEATPLQEIIIQYYPETSEETKIALREKYEVLGYKKCNCTGYHVYELWKMEPHVQIEPTAKVIKKVEEGDVEMTAPNYGFAIPMLNNFSGEEDSSETDYQYSMVTNTSFLSKIVPSNNGVSIAVLDTGIDTNFNAFPVPFLYNSSGNGYCNEQSGYDFVNNDNDPQDDDVERHGTVVSYVIHRELNSRNITHQILPVKIANSLGQSDYFTTLCGLKYAIDVDVEVINMSFGWTNHDPHAYDMFSQLISKTNITMVTSAGNKNSDNDLQPHYPSNFSQNNVLSVAAAKADLSSAAGYSNYGSITVDFFAIGNQVQFPIGTANNVVNYKGTSFASPLVAARAAEILFNGFLDPVQELRRQFAVPVSYVKPVLYQELIQ